MTEGVADLEAPPPEAADLAASTLSRFTRPGRLIAVIALQEVEGHTFVLVFDRAGRPLAGSVLVHGRAAVFPADVLLLSRDASAGVGFGAIRGQSTRLGDWPSTQSGGAGAVVAIQSWSGGNVVAGHSLPPRFDIPIFGGVLLGLLVTLMLVLNGRPGIGEIRVGRPSPPSPSRP